MCRIVWRIKKLGKLVYEKWHSLERQSELSAIVTEAQMLKNSPLSIEMWLEEERAVPLAQTMIAPNV